MFTINYISLQNQSELFHILITLNIFSDCFNEGKGMLLERTAYMVFGKSATENIAINKT